MISIAGTQMQIWAIFWHIRTLTDQPIALGGVGLARIIPVIVFSLIGGAVADAGEKGAYSVIVGRPLFMDGAHTGSTEWNTKSIGVALVGNFSEFPPPMEHQETAARLVRGLCEAMDIPVDREHIVGHREQRATECPGKWFNMDYFVDRVRAAK